MDPFGHHHHHHRRHHGSDDDDDERTGRREPEHSPPYPPPGHNPYSWQPGPPPPPPPFGAEFDSGPVYPPPPVQHVGHEGGSRPGPPPPFGHGPPAGFEEPSGGHFPSFHHHSESGHHGSPPPPLHQHGGDDRFANRRTVRVFPKAGEGYSLTVRDGQVVLAPADPSDPYQHWIKDEKFSTKVKDEEGLPSFALVNKVTGQAIKHSIGQSHPVRLVPYDPDYLDESVLWTESKDTGGDFRCIRMVNNIRLNFDAFHGDKDHGGVRNGTTVVLWEWWKGDNQRWKIVPY